MRLLILSDLHREVWRDAPEQANKFVRALQPDIGQSRPDAVILAGDIDASEKAVAWATREFHDIPVIYVSGNPEAYGQKYDSTQERIAKACSSSGNVHFLSKGELILGSVRFLGATLWTDFQLLGADSYQEALQAAAAGLNDYRKIRLAKAGYRPIRPLDTAQWHQEERTWLQRMLEVRFDGGTVVVTHMASHARSIPERFANELLSAAFASDLSSLIQKSDLWIHGHVHDSMDYFVGDTRIVCNPLGYPHQDSAGFWRQENLAFDPNFVVEV
ncbi:metallophosphoesterase family protein [Stenotrophomonas sp. CFBP8980]|uniref:metallophosphoesterase family protein n=1 Tax=Stenotrophomonas sp. CFBP8980 TaxID=3096523 RepID=UPI002A6B2722|nr:metallophosphoesterase [Stenotrophomonas sp. CFBP8980]MDY1032456.1 metallophosphoesterase family protein [Stenotrophomonas sp. CFBP8980]